MDKFTKTKVKANKADDKFYTIGEVAQILRFSQSSIYKFIKAGRLKAIRFGTGRFRIPHKEVQRILV